MDTCHIFAAGYPLGTPAEYDETIDRLDRSVGLDRLRVWHLNDSCRGCGSRVDRHAAIGAGHLGLEPFRHLVNDPRFRDMPMILETPKGTKTGRTWTSATPGVRQLVRSERRSGGLADPERRSAPGRPGFPRGPAEADCDRRSVMPIRNSTGGRRPRSRRRPRRSPRFPHSIRAGSSTAS